MHERAVERDTTSECPNFSLFTINKLKIKKKDKKGYPQALINRGFERIADGKIGSIAYKLRISRNRENEQI